MIKLEKEQTARFAARLEQETQESVMRDIAQFSEADIVDTWASEPPACAEVHAMVFNMERGVHIDEAIEALREAGCDVMKAENMELLTVRGYTDELWRKYARGPQVFVRQATQSTVRVVRKK